MREIWILLNENGYTFGAFSTKEKAEYWKNRVNTETFQALIIEREVLDRMPSILDSGEKQ